MDAVTTPVRDEGSGLRGQRRREKLTDCSQACLADSLSHSRVVSRASYVTSEAEQRRKIFQQKY